MFIKPKSLLFMAAKDRCRVLNRGVIPLKGFFGFLQYCKHSLEFRMYESSHVDVLVIGENRILNSIACNKLIKRGLSVCLIDSVDNDSRDLWCYDIFSIPEVGALLAKAVGSERFELSAYGDILDKLDAQTFSFMKDYGVSDLFSIDAGLFHLQMNNLKCKEAHDSIMFHVSLNEKYSARNKSKLNKKTKKINYNESKKIERRLFAKRVIVTSCMKDVGFIKDVSPSGFGSVFNFKEEVNNLFIMAGSANGIIEKDSEKASAAIYDVTNLIAEIDKMAERIV